MNELGGRKKRIAVLTSGGDAPGMNACIRSVVRTGIYYGFEVLGFRRGYRGVLSKDYMPLGSRDVSNIIHRGGTFLRTARCPEFEQEEGIQQASNVLKQLEVDALLVIGGNGSLAGARELSDVWSGQVIGLPGTIDNDLGGTDFTVGYDTAVNTALDAIDKVRDTADAHERFFLIEVMGRKSGSIALDVGITGGAEEILIPEERVDIKNICRRLCAGRERGKSSSIIIVAEGAYEGGAYAVAEELKMLSGNEYRVCVLGHIQRGGAPTARDRLLATRLGAYAVDCVARDISRVMVGEMRGELVVTALEVLPQQPKNISQELQKTAAILAV